MDFTNERRDLSTRSSKKCNMFQTPKGTRDILPEDMKKFLKIKDTFRDVYE